MRTKILFLVILVTPIYLVGQKIIKSAPYYPTVKKQIENVEIKHHSIAINPLNALFFQQIGLTYEYRFGKVGFGLTPGYIYPNKAEYSNWFIVGPTKFGSFGWYSGWFIVPQVNLYLVEQVDPDEGGVLYLAAKFVYKFMHLDTLSIPVWRYDGDGYGLYRKMLDDVKVYGGFLDLGYRYFFGHFFLDLNLGPGFIWLNHDMTIYAQSYGSAPSYLQSSKNPVKETYKDGSITINFTLTLGVAF